MATGREELGSLEKRLLLAWKEKLENLRCAILDIDVRFVVSGTLMARLIAPEASVIVDRSSGILSRTRTRSPKRNGVTGLFPGRNHLSCCPLRHIR
ncbi:MAG TPA: hypothetical protein VF514_02910 [Bacteroidota bacterium]